MSAHFPWRLRALSVAFSVAVSIGGTHAQTVLTLEAALQQAELMSRQLAGQQAAAQAAREMAVAAGQRPDPVLRIGLTNVPVDGTGRYSLTRDFMTMRSIAVMQELTRADKRTARAARMNREADVADAARAMALAQVRQATAAAWLDAHFLQRMLELQAAQRTEVALQSEAAQASYRGGRGAQTDVFAARTSLAQIDDAMLQTRRDIGIARTQLARWTGPSAQHALGTPPVLDRLPTGLDGSDFWLQNDPRVALWRQREATSLADAEVTRSNLRADWTVELMFSQRGPKFSNMASLNLTIPLQWDQDQRQNRELAARLLLVQQAADEREDMVRDLAAQTRVAILQWNSQRERIAHVDTQLLPLAAERARAALAAYRGGSGTLIAVLEARHADLDLGIERLRLEMDSARLWSSLVYRIPESIDVGTAQEQQP